MNVSHFEKFESYIPINLNMGTNFILACVLIYSIVLFRYFLMVGVFWVLFYRIKIPWSLPRQIYAELPSAKEQLYEIKWSVITSLLFALAGALMGVFWQNGWTQIYLNFDQYGYWYLLFSWLVLLFLHDAYFYLAHRWLHIPAIYRKYHLIHHALLKPSPWGSFSFHPVESIINAAAIPLFIFILPLHPVVILFHLTFMTISAITNHMGFEILPKNGARHWFWKWMISGVHHTEHHKYFRVNYGLFFTWWDVWLKTEYEKYADEFDQVMNRTQKKELGK